MALRHWGFCFLLFLLPIKNLICYNTCTNLMEFLCYSLLPMRRCNTRQNSSLFGWYWTNILLHHLDVIAVSGKPHNQSFTVPLAVPYDNQIMYHQFLFASAVLLILWEKFDITIYCTPEGLTITTTQQPQACPCLGSTVLFMVSDPHPQDQSLLVKTSPKRTRDPVCPVRLYASYG